MIDELLACSSLPGTGATVDLAVSGGTDSVGLALMAHARGLRATIHHVDHHLRPTSGDDAALVRDLANRLGFPFVLHEVAVDGSGNVEAHARAARRAVLPTGVLTAHTMDDLAESVLINMLRGSGLDGLAPMVNDPTKPLIGVRRAALARFVEASGERIAHDETNQDVRFLRNRVRHELLPAMVDAAGRDLVALLYRQAVVIAEERTLLDELLVDDTAVGIDEADCRVLAAWTDARLHRWLHRQLTRHEPDGVHAPSRDEVLRATAVVRGDVVAMELSGGRRLSRTNQRLSLRSG